MTLTPKPLIVTFVELMQATEELHQGDKALIASLHDIWLLGAPTPTSIIRNPKHYDPRKVQPGNVEQRIVLPLQIARWIYDTSGKRGIQFTWRQAMNIALGQPDYNLDGESF